MAWTRDQQNAAWRAWYSKNRGRKISWQKRRRREIREIVWLIKAGSSCLVCGETRPQCLVFHHRESSTKEFEIGNVGAGTWSVGRVLKEIRKCVVLCANCHLKHHDLEKRAGRGLVPT